MSIFLYPHVEVSDRRGAVITIASGDLPEFPAWFEQELRGLLDRLHQEARRREQQLRENADG